MQAQEQPDELEMAVNEAIAACDGDLRATIRSLIVANDFLLERLEQCRPLISVGFVRKRLDFLDPPGDSGDIPMRSP
jgi:hypothetical protein